VTIPNSDHKIVEYDTTVSYEIVEYDTTVSYKIVEYDTTVSRGGSRGGEATGAPPLKFEKI
jgi:hypothetical protein